MSPDSESGNLVGANLAKAREYLGLSLESVAAQMRLPVAEVIAMESDSSVPSEAQLSAFSKIYCRPKRYFWSVAKLPPAEPALFRTTSDLTDEDRFQLERFSEFLSEAGPAPEWRDKV